MEKTAFNGTQMAQVYEYGRGVGAEEISREFAVAALSLLLQITPEQADKLLANMGKGFKPKEPDPPAFGPGGPGTPPKPGAPGKPPIPGVKKPSAPGAKLDADDPEPTD